MLSLNNFICFFFHHTPPDPRIEKQKLFFFLVCFLYSSFFSFSSPSLCHVFSSMISSSFLPSFSSKDKCRIVRHFFLTETNIQAYFTGIADVFLRSVNPHHPSSQCTYYSLFLSLSLFSRHCWPMASLLLPSFLSFASFLVLVVFFSFHVFNLYTILS